MIANKELSLLHPYLKIHADDNVLVALKDLSSGSTIYLDSDQLLLLQDVSAKHKFFTTDLNEGDDVIMYGTLVGKAQCFIPKGTLMTTANTKHAAGAYSYRGLHVQWEKPDTSKFLN